MCDVSESIVVRDNSMSGAWEEHMDSSMSFFSFFLPCQENQVNKPVTLEMVFKRKSMEKKKDLKWEKCTCYF